MLEERLPVHIDPFRFAEQRRLVAGRLPVVAMERLVQSLDSSEGDVGVELEFGIDQEGIRFVSGRLRAVLSLVCQGCLEPMEYPVDTRVQLAFASSEAEAKRLPGRYEPLLVDPDGQLFLKDVIEDELILALPIIARHAEDECAAEGAGSVGKDEGEAGPRENPFAVLARLKNVAKPDEE